MTKNNKLVMRLLVWAVATLFAASWLWAADINRKLLPGTYPLGTLRPDTGHRPEDVYVYIQAAARAYGDSVVLRWAVPSYPEWRYLNATGYDIYRADDAVPGFMLDTLATGVKPLGLERFRACYPDTVDSVAYMAIGALYGSGDMTPEMTNYEPGTVGAFTELEQDQKTRLMAGFLAAEWRPDVAQAMGLRFVDRTARRGHIYSYYVVPTVTDTTGHFFIMPAMVEHLKNVAYRPAPYNVTLTDSILGHGSVALTWNDTINGTFYIYSRPYGTTEWTRLNERPYVPPFKVEFDRQDVTYEHTHGKTGTFEYAVQAYDAFGDLTAMSAPLKVYFPDMQPPTGPEITSIVIDRPGSTLWQKVYADVHFRKDSLEKDFVRYIPMYYNERDSLRQWRLLSNQYIAPTDTMVRIDVTNVSTGMLTIAAVDTAGNMGYSFPKLLRVQDAKPPQAPVNVRAYPALDGSVAIMWDMPDSLDVQYYDIMYANSPQHTFALANDRHVTVRSFTDTIATDMNQRYIYYTVRAVDWNMNIGACSDTIAVLRPNPAPPSKAHLDSAWVDDSMVHMRWIGGGDEIISHYDVYRRKAGTAKWSLLRTFNADSVKAGGHVMLVDDAPGGSVGQRFEYAVETFSFWDVSSGLTPVYSAKLNYGRVVDSALRIFGTYNAKDACVRLGWEMGQKPADAPYYFCLYRRRHDDTSFSYITDLPNDRLYYTDHSLAPGEWAEYRVSIRYDDGRQSLRSNTVRVEAPSRLPNVEQH